MQAADIPLHVLVYNGGKLWAAVCLRCGTYFAASPKSGNLHAAVELHACEAKQSKNKAAVA